MYSNIKRQISIMQKLQLLLLQPKTEKAIQKYRLRLVAEI